MAPRKSMETAIRTVAPDVDQTTPPSSPLSSKKTNTKPSRSAESADEAESGNHVNGEDAASAEGGEADANGKPSEDKDGKDGKDLDAIVIEDLTLPKSIMTRLAKADLPTGTQIQANAMMAITRSTTVFINHLASAANENTKNSGKKTILPADVFKALDDTEFSFMREQLELEFAKYTEIQAVKRTKKKPASSKKDISDAAANADSAPAAVAESDEEDDGPRLKRAKVDESTMDVDEDEDGSADDEEEQDVQGEDEQGEDEDEEEGEGEGENGEDDEDDEAVAHEEYDAADGVDDDPELVEERLQRELLTQNDDSDDGDDSD
ncbi:hypothetical protein CFIMG_005195RA [Ceratocystis fimbriata CBS 114723]|uniref:DNA polymerase epsilon subunit D n=2 Tax=Ceratocystis TaxID=5157 RepID=A0A0F8CRA9_CERFI|nr:DNA polymerase epsilon subunit D [Ceratocystis platani]PHH50160.1 hypothetical protein CFIMG_005195RA [Ceratocystis fimbriata CBS 114723]